MSPYCWVLLAEELGVIWQFLYTFLVKMIFEPKLKKKIWQIFKKSRCSHSTSQFQLPTPGFIRFTRNETHNHTYKVTTTYANDETHRPSNACQLVLFGVRSSIPLGSDLFARHDFITIILGQTHNTHTHSQHTHIRICSGHCVKVRAFKLHGLSPGFDQGLQGLSKQSYNKV